MANTWGGTDDSLILQAGFESFKEKLAPISAFSTDMSPSPSFEGASVVTRVITKMTAAAFGASGYETGDTTTTAKTVTLNKHIVMNFHMTDVEKGKSSAASSTMELQAVEAANAVARYVMGAATNGILAAVTNANFGAAGFTGAATNFDSDDVADIADAMDDDSVPESGRALILSNAYYTALRKDSSIKARYASGADTLQTGDVPNLSGFSVWRSNNIPANGENLVGLAAAPSAIAFASRTVEPQGNIEFYGVASDPETGLSLGFRRHYDDKLGIMWGSFESLYGWTVCQATGIQRIVSA